MPEPNPEVVAFVVCAVAALRKYWPAIDGPFVLVVAWIVSMLVCCGLRIGRGDEHWAAALFEAVVTTVAAVGASSFASHMLGKASHGR